VVVPVPVPVVGSKKPIPVEKKVTFKAPALPDTAAVVFTVDGQQSDATVDTTALNDGTHTVTATAQDSNGKKETVTQKVTVQNKSSNFSGVLGAAGKAAPWAGLALVVLVLGIVGYSIYHRSRMAGMVNGARTADPMSNVYMPDDERK
jgi:hypothetical protein